MGKLSLCIPPWLTRMSRTGFFSGSFDPMTNGHLDVIEQAAWLCDRLVVGVGFNPNKVGLFTVEERLALVREAAEYDADAIVDVRFEVDDVKGVDIEGVALQRVTVTGLAVRFARAEAA